MIISNEWPILKGHFCLQIEQDYAYGNLEWIHFVLGIFQGHIKFYRLIWLRQKRVICGRGDFLPRDVSLYFVINVCIGAFMQFSEKNKLQNYSLADPLWELVPPPKLQENPGSTTGLPSQWLKSFRYFWDVQQKIWGKLIILN